MSTQHGQPLPPIPEGFQLPFYYSSLTNCEVFYLVSPDVVRPYLKDTGLEPAIFGGKACVSFNFQQYTGQFPNASNVTQELELNILAYPKREAAIVADVTFEQFFAGDEQTKIIGNHRVWVPCDAPIAIAAGKKLFGEPKFQTTFAVNLPSLNDPKVKTWSFATNDPDAPPTAKETIFTCEVDLRDLDPTPVNPSPQTEYGTHQGKLIGCRWTILAPYQGYRLGEAQAKRVRLFYGTSPHPMRQDMEKLIGKTLPAAVRTYQSPPVAIQSRAYYP